MTKTPTKAKTAPESLRDRVLRSLDILRVPVTEDHLDAQIRRAEQEGLSPLAFLERLVGEMADHRKERAIERRIREARFKDRQTFEVFDWEFNKKAIDRAQMEELSQAEFVRRRENLVFIGPSGIGKSHLIQGIGIKACAAGFKVRYTPSAQLLADLSASLADKTLTQKVRRYSKPDLLIIDCFGFDRIEREEWPKAANLLYKVIDARYRQRSTALIANIDFKAWSDYLGDPPLAMAFLDRLVDGALIFRFPKARSYRAARSKDRTIKDGGQEETPP